jgi:hypothetical protein
LKFKKISHSDIFARFLYLLIFLLFNFIYFFSCYRKLCKLNFNSIYRTLSQFISHSISQSIMEINAKHKEFYNNLQQYKSPFVIKNVNTQWGRITYPIQFPQEMCHKNLLISYIRIYMIFTFAGRINFYYFSL